MSSRREGWQRYLQEGIQGVRYLEEEVQERIRFRGGLSKSRRWRSSYGGGIWMRTTPPVGTTAARLTTRPLALVA